MDRRQFLQGSLGAAFAAPFLGDQTHRGTATFQGGRNPGDVQPAPVTRKLVLDVHSRSLQWLRSADEVAEAAIEMVCRRRLSDRHAVSRAHRSGEVARSCQRSSSGCAVTGCSVTQITGPAISDLTGRRPRRIIGAAAQAGCTHYSLGGYTSTSRNRSRRSSTQSRRASIGSSASTRNTGSRSSMNHRPGARRRRRRAGSPGGDEGVRSEVHRLPLGHRPHGDARRRHVGDADAARRSLHRGGRLARSRLGAGPRTAGRRRAVRRRGAARRAAGHAAGRQRHPRSCRSARCGAGRWAAGGGEDGRWWSRGRPRRRRWWRGGRAQGGAAGSAADRPIRRAPAASTRTTDVCGR